MTDSNTSTKKLRIKPDVKDDSVFSKNHSKSVKFRLRIQEQKEAEELIKEYKEKQAEKHKRIP